MDKKVIGGLIGLLLVIGISFIPIKTTEVYSTSETYTEMEPYEVQEPYSVQEPYKKTETYYEKEPYSDQECSTKQEPYTDQECTTQNYAYNVKYTKCQGRSLLSDAQVEITVNNLENKQGYFTFWVGFNLPDGNQIGKETSKLIQAMSSATFSYSADADVKTCQYYDKSIPTYQTCQNVIKYRSALDCQTVTKYRDVAKTREVTDYQTVTKYNTVTKYQQVPKERTVLKTRTVLKPIYQIIAEKFGLM